jgi:hypothetical protein
MRGIIGIIDEVDAHQVKTDIVRCIVGFQTIEFVINLLVSGCSRPVIFSNEMYKDLYRMGSHHPAGIHPDTVEITPLRMGRGTVVIVLAIGSKPKQ